MRFFFGLVAIGLFTSTLTGLVHGLDVQPQHGR